MAPLLSSYLTGQRSTYLPLCFHYKNVGLGELLTSLVESGMRNIKKKGVGREGRDDKQADLLGVCCKLCAT